MTAIIPKLGLHDIPDGDLEEYTLDKVTKIDAAGSPFSGLDPSTAEVAGKADDYKNALVAADNGTVAQTEAKNVLRSELEAMLTQQAQHCSDIANGNLTIYLLSGYEAKDSGGSPVGELAKPDLMKVDPTDNEGELKVDWDTIDHAQNYTVRAYTDPADPEGSKLAEEIVSPSRANLQGLPSGEKILVDVRANGGSTGHGPWSDAGWARPR